MELKKIKCPSCGGELERLEDSDEMKCKFCGTEIIIDDKATEVSRIKKAEVKAKKELDDHELENRKKNDDYNDEREYNKKKNTSKIKGLSIVLAIICLLFTFTAFRDGEILSGLIGIIQVVLFGYAFLLCLDVLPEKIKNLHKIVFIGGCVLIIPFLALGNGSSSKYEKIDWDDIVLGDNLPELTSSKGKIFTNSEDSLSIYIKDDKKGYKKYVEDCIKYGYTIDSEKDDMSYTAYNKDGYELSIKYYDYNKEYNIDLDAPLEMKNNVWPNSDLANMLPRPKSTKGRVENDSSENFLYYAGETDKEAFEEYITAVKEKGFTIDYDKSDTTYKAKNSNNYEVIISKENNNVMSIQLVKTTIESSNPSETSTNSNGLRPEFKKAMDDYESFMNEYVEFMKKYNANPSDMTLLSEYANYLQKYTKAVESFDKWDDEEINDTETKYYLEVQSRVLKKLSEVE